jgi:predicted small metal-binding protein
MDYDCGATVVGESLAELLKSVQLHAIDHHNFTKEETEAPEKIAIWEGAIKQSSRPGSFRTTRKDFGTDVEPH